MFDGVTMGTWTGREARALREARRMTVREWAAYLGVSERTVSKWEASMETLVPRPEMQAALDTALEDSSLAVKARFVRMLDGATGDRPAGTECSMFVHRFVGAHIGTDAVAALKGKRIARLVLPGWLDAKTAGPLHHGDRPATTAQLYLFGCGAAIAHLCDRVDAPQLADVATMYYRHRDDERAWIAEQLAGRLDAVGHKLTTDAHTGPPLYWLTRWDGEATHALRLLCMPGLLVDRDHPTRPRAITPQSEQYLLTVGVEHPDLHAFGLRGISVGYASWAAHAYHPASPDRALSVDNLVAAELTLRALDFHLRWLVTQADAGHPPPRYGRDWLHTARRALTRPGRQSIPHSLLWQALMKATDIDEQLANALDDRPEE